MMLRALVALALALAADATRPVYTPSPTFVSADLNAAARSVYSPSTTASTLEERFGLKTDDGEDSAYASSLLHASMPPQPTLTIASATARATSEMVKRHTNFRRR